MSMPPVQALLARLRDAGVTASVEGHDLVLRPADRLTPELADRLREAKADIIAALNTNPTPHPAPLAAGIAPGDLPMLDDFRAAFPDAEIVEAVTEDHGGKAASPARQAEAIIEAARERGEAPDLRDAWNERLAICTVSGGLPENDAQVIGLAELRGKA